MLDSPDNQEPENPIEDTKSVAKSAHGAVKTAKAAKGAVETAKLAAAAVSTGGTGAAAMLALKLKGLINKIPILKNLVPLLNKLNSTAKKIAAGIAAYIAYLLLKLGAQVAGLVAGLAFGVITGLPLLLVPVVGPYLYAGWVAYNGIRGLQNPAAAFSNLKTAIHYATHPWELVTKPLGFAKDAVVSAGSNIAIGIKGIANGIGSAISGTVSTIGSVAFGTVSAVWGGITGSIGSVIGFGATVSNFLIGGLGSLSIPTSLITVPLSVGLGSLGIGTIFFTGFVIPAAFFSAEGDLGTVHTPGENQYFTLTKTASQSSISNQSSGSSVIVTFTITLTANDTILNNVQVLDEAKGGPSGSILITTDSSGNPISPINCPTTMNPGEICTHQISLRIDSRFNDSIVTNTARVIVTPEGQGVQTEAVTTLVIVGTPSTTCPSGWPTATGGNGITQGPLGGTSHARLAGLGEQAIDIGVSYVPTVATFNGIVSFAGSIGDGYGNYVDVVGICNGAQFTARWAHLNSINAGINAGANVATGQSLGTTGQTGNVTGAHLHYSFWVLPMTTPYIPRNVAFPSCNSSSECNVNW